MSTAKKIITYPLGSRVIIRDQMWKVLHCMLDGLMKVVGVCESNRGVESEFLTYLENVVIADSSSISLPTDLSKINTNIENLSLIAGPYAVTTNIPDLQFTEGRIDVKEYQFEPLWQIQKLAVPRLLIADDVGLGKTIEAGLILEHYRRINRAKRVLIVCPASLQENFQREMLEKFNFFFQIVDSKRLIGMYQKIPFYMNPWMHQDLDYAITSLDFIKQVQQRKLLDAAKWDFVILDECHHITKKGGSVTDRHKLASTLSNSTNGLILMSATPHDGKTESFSSLFSLLNPTLVHDGFWNEAEYKRYYVRRLKKDLKDNYGVTFLERKVQNRMCPDEQQVTSAPYSAELAFYDQLSGFLSDLQVKEDRYAGILDFTKVLIKKRFLSSPLAGYRTFKKIFTDRSHDNFDQKDLSNFKLQSGEISKKASGLVNQLKDFSSKKDAKLTFLLELLQETNTKDQHIIIFTEYIDTLEYIYSNLPSALQKGTLLFAGNAEALKNIDKRFTPDYVKRELGKFEMGSKSAPKILISTDVGSEGRNLHKICHIAVNYELPWNPSKIEQRNGRIDRYGQDQTPQIYNILRRHVYEDELLGKIQDKLETIRKELGSLSDVLCDDLNQFVENEIAAGETPELLSQKIQDVKPDIANFLTFSSNPQKQSGHQKIISGWNTQQFVNNAIKTHKIANVIAGNDHQHFHLQIKDPIFKTQFGDQLDFCTYEGQGQSENYLNVTHPFVEFLRTYLRSLGLEENNHRFSLLSGRQKGHIFGVYLQLFTKTHRIFGEKLNYIFVPSEGKEQIRIFADYDKMCEQLGLSDYKNSNLKTSALQKEFSVQKEKCESFITKSSIADYFPELEKTNQALQKEGDQITKWLANYSTSQKNISSIKQHQMKQQAERFKSLLLDNCSIDEHMLSEIVFCAIVLSK